MEHSNININEEADRLLEILNAHEVRPDQLEAGFKEFSVECKNELLVRLSRIPEPASQGRLLARLPFILTDKNKTDMTNVFVANLRSPYPDARKFSLYGLEKLGHPNTIDLALASLRDDDDQVIVAACNILLPKAKQAPHLWKSLQDIYAIHKDKKEFYGTISLLEAHGIKNPKPDAN